MKGAASSLGNIKAALPYMDSEMRELEKRTLSKGGALAEREYAELYQTEARKRYTECGSDSCFFQREGFIPYPLKNGVPHCNRYQNRIYTRRAQTVFYGCLRPVIIYFL